MDLSEFSKAAGVSPATVSYVLSGTGRISDKTRRLVRERMAELGYVPNLSARELASGRSRTVLVPFRNADLLTDPYLAEVTQGVLVGLRRRGYGVLLDVAGEGEEDEALAQRARSRAFAGSVLFEGFYLSDDLLGQIASARHPCVVTDPGRVRSVPHVSTVLYDADGGMREAARHLVGLGHRRIAVLNDAGLSCGAFLDEARRLGAPVAPERAASMLPSVENAAEAVRRFLSLPERQRPTALFARKDVLALAALREARRAGWTVPHDLSVVGFDDTHLNRLADPPLTAVSLDCSALGGLLADALCERIERPGPEPAAQRHPARLVVRGSTAAPPVHNSGQEERTNP